MPPPAAPPRRARRTRRPAVVVAMAVLALALSLTPASSQESPDELRDDLARANDRLSALDVRASAAVEDYNQAQAELSAVEAELGDAEEHARRLEREVERLSQVAADYANQLFRMGPALDLQAALASSDPTEAGRKAATLSRITSIRLADIEMLGARRDELDAVHARLATRRSEVARREQQLDERRAELTRTLADQRNEVETLRDEVAAAEQREREEAARQARAERERARASVEAAPTSPDPPPAPSASTPGVRRSAQTAVDAAVAQVGKPYQWGGSGPGSYDCSGLTAWGWKHAGVYLPHSSRMQYAATTRISRGDLQPGDLVFFGRPIHHVAMYIGGGRVVEAPYSGKSVRISSSALGRGDIVGYGRP